MDFSDIERAVYGEGNLEDDEELMAELLALEAETRTENRAVKVKPNVPTPAVRTRPGPVATGPPNPQDISALLDDAQFSIVSDPGDDVEVEESDELLAELSEVLGDTPVNSTKSSIPSEKAPTAVTSTESASNPTLVYMTELKQHYEKMKAASDKDGNASKSRRLARQIETFNELIGKAKRGQQINSNDIPPAPNGWAPGAGRQVNVEPTVPTPSLVPIRTVSPKVSTSSPIAAPIQSPPPAPTVAPSVPASVPSASNPTLVYMTELKQHYEKMKAASDKDGNASKSRRLARQIETFNELIGKAKRGQQINSNDIPPAPNGWAPGAGRQVNVEPTVPTPPLVPIRTVSPKVSTSSPIVNAERTVPPAVPARNDSIQQPTRNLNNASTKKQLVKETLIRRRNAYVANGKAAVQAGDKPAAMQFVEVSKMFDQAIGLLETASEDDLDLSECPPSPPPYKKKVIPKTFLDGLEQRKATYAELVEKFKNSGDERKARMYTRIIGEYNEAIMLARAGKPVQVDDLTSLPNMPPLPPQTSGPSPSRPTNAQITNTEASPKRKPLPAVGVMASSGEVGKSRNQTHLEFLLNRQKQFRDAAIIAKKQGNNEGAKHYLLQSKGFDKMITRAKAGLPIDIKDTPIPPQALVSTTTLEPRIVSSSNSSTGVEGRGEVLSTIEQTLIEQVKFAETNRMRFTRLGDVGKVNMFENWSKISKTDLLLIREVAKQGLKVPRFQYEIRDVPTADLHPDLAEDVLELTINNCRDVPLPAGYEPNHAAIFVKYSFPYPMEAHQTGKTKTVNETISPVFDEKFLLKIGDRRSRAHRLLRVLKRSPLKLEVYQKGSFLRSDKLLGVCEYKLEALEQKAEIVDSTPLKDGRKAVGGLISFKTRAREPLGDNKLQNTKQKWLVLLN